MATADGLAPPYGQFPWLRDYLVNPVLIKTEVRNDYLGAYTAYVYSDNHVETDPVGRPPDRWGLLHVLHLCRGRVGLTALTLGGSGYGVLSGGTVEAGTFEIRIQCPSAGQITISAPVPPPE